MDDLYQQIIIDHAKNPRNQGELGEKAFEVHLNNPLCGDQVSVWVDYQSNKVVDVKCKGEGCTISQASCSIMSELAKGADQERLKQLIADFQSLLHGTADDTVRERLGELIALSGVRNYPARVRCAFLAFEALQKVLEAIGQGVTPDVTAEPPKDESGTKG